MKPVLSEGSVERRAGIVAPALDCNSPLSSQPVEQPHRLHFGLCLFQPNRRVIHRASRLTPCSVDVLCLFSFSN